MYLIADGASGHLQLRGDLAERSSEIGANELW